MSTRPISTSRFGLTKPCGSYRTFRTAGWTSIGLFVIYLLNTYVIYLHGS